MTPYIVRLYWVLALILATLYLADKAVEGAFTSNARVTQSSDQSEIAVRAFLRQGSKSPSEAPPAVIAFGWIIRILTTLILVLCAVLAVRVWYEILIVVFNMANSLHSIDAGIISMNQAKTAAAPS
jgi:hypothetical protein